MLLPSSLQLTAILAAGAGALGSLLENGSLHLIKDSLLTKSANAQSIQGGSPFVILFNSFASRLTFRDNDRSISDDRVVILDTPSDASLIRSYKYPEMYLCPSGIRAVLSPLPVKQSECYWSIRSDDLIVSIRSASNPAQSLALSGADVLLSREVPQWFRVEKGTPRLSASKEEILARHSKRQTTNHTNYLLISKPSGQFELRGVRMYTRGSTQRIDFDLAGITTSVPGYHNPESIYDSSYLSMYSNRYYADASQEQWLKIPFSANITEIERIELINDPFTAWSSNPGFLEGIHGVQLSLFIDSKRSWNTTITRIVLGAVIYVSKNGVYPDGLILRNPTTGLRYENIVDSALAALQIGASITVPLPVTGPPRLIIYQNNTDSIGACNALGFQICEIKIFTNTGSLVTPTGARVSSSDVSFSPSIMWDGNTTSCYRAKIPSPTAHYVNIKLPSTVTDVRRIVVNNPTHAGACHSDIAVIIGNKTFFTRTQSQWLPETFTVPVRMDGVYETGLLVRDHASKKIFRIESGKRRSMNVTTWKLSGYPPYITVADHNILSMPLGLPISAPLALSGNFIALNQGWVCFNEVRVIYTDGLPATIPAANVFAECGENELTLVDGNTNNTFPVQIKRDPVFIRLPSTTKRLRSVIFFFGKPCTYAQVGPYHLHVRHNGFSFESERFSVADHFHHTNMTINLDPIVGAPAKYEGIAREYPHTVGATFPNTPSTRHLNVSNEQCPQLCDRTTGCVAFALENGKLTDCIIYRGTLTGAMASTTIKTYVAVSTYTAQIIDYYSVAPVHIGHRGLPRPDEWVWPKTDVLPGNSLYSCMIDDKCVGSYYSYYTSYKLVHSRYMTRFTDLSISLPADPSLCTGADATYAIVNGKCMKIIQKYNPVYDSMATTFIKMFGVNLRELGMSNIRIDESQDGMMVRFGKTFEYLLLTVLGEVEFELEVKICGENCENRYLFESIKQPGKYICQSQNAIALLPKETGAACEWLAVFSPAMAFKSALNSYHLTSNDYGEIELVWGFPNILKIFSIYFSNRSPLGRAYTAAEAVQFNNSVTIKSYVGPVSLCSVVCDKTVGCKGYTIYAAKNGCDIKSDVGIRTNISSTAHTVSLVSLVTNLTDAVPWQIKMALLGGKSRTYATGAGIHIHIIDSGVTPFRGEKGFFDDLRVPPNSNWTDNGFHADAIVGILRRGIVPGASIHNLKIFDSNGVTNSTMFVRAVMDVLQKASNNFRHSKVTRPTIISVSAVFPQNYPIDCIMKIAYNMGVFLVVAAGNDEVAYDDWRIMSPAASRVAMVVGSYDSDFRIKNSKHGRYVDIYAAGCRFTDEKDSSRFISGTSLAAPQVAGVMAKFLEENPEYQELEPVYTYRAIKSSGIPGLLKDVSPTTHNVVLSGLTTKIPYRLGEWVHEVGIWTPQSLSTAKQCTLDEALRLAPIEVVQGKLVASSVSASASEDLVTPFLQDVDVAENQL